MGCFRCSNTYRSSRGRNCPARKKKCNESGQIGHFAVCRETKDLRHSARNAEKKDTNQSRAYQGLEDLGGGSQDYFAFAVGAVESTCGG